MQNYKIWYTHNLHQNTQTSTFTKCSVLVGVSVTVVTCCLCAGCQGADFVEFDVQLSKDWVPVVYHDFQVCLAIRKVSPLQSCLYRSVRKYSTCGWKAWKCQNTLPEAQKGMNMIFSMTSVIPWMWPPRRCWFMAHQYSIMDNSEKCFTGRIVQGKIFLNTALNVNMWLKLSHWEPEMAVLDVHLC